MKTSSSIAKYGSLLLLQIGIYMLDTFVALIHDLVVTSHEEIKIILLKKKIMPEKLHIRVVLLFYMT
jgi:hypothetical protein